MLRLLVISAVRSLWGQFNGRQRGRGLRSGRGAAGALLVAVVSAGATLCVVFVPSLHFAYRERGLHVALETTATVVGLLAAFLVAGRLHRGRGRDDWLLATGLAVLAVANLSFGAVPAALEQHPGPYATWSAVACRCVGALLVCASAFVAGRVRRRPGRLVSAAIVSALAIVGAIALVLASVASRLPRGVTSAPELSNRPRLDGDPALLAIQLLVALAFALAAIGFSRRSGREDDRFLGWLAGAAVLHSASSVNYFLYPSLYSEWVYTGDAFRLGFYLVLFAGAALEIATYWRSAARLAVLEERRRIAREFHDGVAQELAYIDRAARTLIASGADEELALRLRGAAHRGLDESRRAIDALAPRNDAGGNDAFEQVLQDAVRATADRYGVSTRIDIDRRLELDEGQAHALIRIATEAITNAIRHGGACEVDLTLAPVRDRVVLRVADRGTGFDPHFSARGFGLTSMRERAEALGGEMRLTTAPGEGTVVEAVL